MRGISIAKEKYGISSCNICSARNYEVKNENASAFGIYKKDLCELHIGSMCMCLCKDCLRLIDNKIVAFLDAEPENDEEE